MNKEYRDWIVRFGAKPGEYDVPIKPIVYCEDCKNYGVFGMCTFNGRCEFMEHNDFCSKGETNE